MGGHSLVTVKADECEPVGSMKIVGGIKVKGEVIPMFN
jgi:hypothetical protein